MPEDDYLIRNKQFVRDVLGPKKANYFSYQRKIPFTLIIQNFLSSSVISDCVL